MTERGPVFEDFADKVDEVFVIGQDGVPAIPLTLKGAELLKSGLRAARHTVAILTDYFRPRPAHSPAEPLPHGASGAWKSLPGQ